MARNTYQLFCTFCNFKKISDGTDLDGFREIPRAGIQKGVVAQSKKFNEPSEDYLKKTINQIKQFKCPECGFAIRAKKIVLETKKGEDE